MALRIYTMSYGSPGDVEKQRVLSPGTLTEWIEKAKKGRESEGSYVTCVAQEYSVPGNPETKKQNILINLEAVEWVVEVE